MTSRGADNPRGVPGAGLFDAAPPRVSEALAEQIAREVFGLEGAVASLPSERDRNFLLRVRSGSVHQ